MGAPIGIFGRPWIDLEGWLDLEGLAEVDAEIRRGLALTPELTHTGGGLKSMGVVAPEVQADPTVDYGQVFARFTPGEWRRFAALSDDPSAPPPDGPGAWGDETDRPLGERQIRFLKYRHRVYFPWKVAWHFVLNERWEDNHSGAGKGFVEEARALFPRTVALMQRLPFQEIGRALVFGLSPFDHAPLHRDTPPAPGRPVAHSISLCPRADKRFYLMDPERTQRLVVPARAYWFNDMDWHGVLPDPFFRYSIRVDGVFRAAFFDELRRRHRGPA